MEGSLKFNLKNCFTTLSFRLAFASIVIRLLDKFKFSCLPGALGVRTRVIFSKAALYQYITRMSTHECERKRNNSCTIHNDQTERALIALLPSPYHPLCLLSTCFDNYLFIKLLYPRGLLIHLDDFKQISN